MITNDLMLTQQKKIALTRFFLDISILHMQLRSFFSFLLACSNLSHLSLFLDFFVQQDRNVHFTQNHKLVHSQE